MEQKRRIVTLLIFILALSSLIRTVYLLWNSTLPDLGVLYNSAAYLLEHKNPYISKILFTQVYYSPLALLFISPILLFSFAIASKIWLISSIIFLGFSVFILYRINPIPALSLSIFFFLLVLSFPFKFTMGMGQINILILFLLSVFLVSENKILKSLSLSLSILVKAFPLLLMIVLILKFKRKELLLTSFISVFLLLCSLVIVGTNINFYYFDKVLLPLLKYPAGEIYYNQSISGFMARLGIFGAPVFILKILIFSFTIFIIRRKNQSLTINLVLMLITILIINNFTWQHHLVLLVLPYYFLIAYKLKKLSFLLILISYFLIAFNISNPEYYKETIIGNIYLSHGFFGMLLLWIMLLFEKNHKYEK